MKKWDVIVVGAGNGGLSAAANLSRRGKRVLVLEQHNLPCGFATSFVRGRFEFEASLHELGGVGHKPGEGNNRRALEAAGVIDKLEWLSVPSAYKIITLSDEESICASMPFGVKAYIDKIEEYVPGCRESVEKLFKLGDEMDYAIDLFGKVNGSIDFATIKDMLKNCMNFVRTSGYSTLEVLDALNIPKKAQKILTAYWCYLGEDIKELSFMHFMSMLRSYITFGAVFPKGKSHEMSCSFVDEIEKHGGEVWFNTRVAKIMTEDGSVKGVKTEDGREIKANHIICNCSPHMIYGQLIDNPPVEEVKKANTRVLHAKGFSMFLGLDKSPEELGIDDHSYFIYDKADSVEQVKLMNRITTNNAQATVCLNKVYPDCSPEGTTIMYFTTLYMSDDWGNVRPEEHHKVKRAVADKMINNFEKATGIKIRDSIEEIEIASPVTYAHYTDVPQGTIYGYRTQGWDSVLQRNIMVKNEPTIKGLRFCGGFGMNGIGYSSAFISGRDCAQYTIEDMEGASK